MSCRHIIDGDALFTIFVAQVNSDQTEGKGTMKDCSFYLDPFEAQKRILGQGVMGVGDGDVVRRKYHQCPECPAIFVVDTLIYKGAWYGRGRNDIMTDGWHKDYSPITNDPDYATYLKLKEKFE